MQIVHFYHRHRMHRLAGHPDFSLFELAIWLHTLAYSLIAVFVPILLRQTGYSVGEVMLYYLIFNIIDVPLNFAAGNLVRKIGARRTLILATIAVIAFFGLLGVLPPDNWPVLILLAAIAAAYDTLFWVAHFYMFMETNRGGLDAGKSVGALETVRRLASIIGPAVGALVLIIDGKSALSIASIAIFALSIVPLYHMRHTRDVPAEKKLSLREFFAEPQEKRDYLSMALWSFHDEADYTLWPLFIFGVFQTVGAVAAVPVIVAITTAALSYFAGTLTKRYATRMTVVGSAVIACAWILRLTVHDPVLYYVTVFLVGFFSLLVSIPRDGSITARGLEIGPLQVSTYRNAISMVMRIPLYALLVLLVEVFKVSFSLAALSAFLVLLVTMLFRSSGILKPYRNQK